MNNAVLFTSLVVILGSISFVLDKEKTFLGFRKGLKMFFNVALPMLHILMMVSLILYLLPNEVIEKYLGSGSGLIGVFTAALFGSIAIIPPFVSFPIAAGLIESGASYTTVSTFMTTLMMVGVASLPLEIKYFGKKVAILRNVMNFFAAILIGLLVGLIL